MINLLPPQQKKELFYEERYKLLIILGISAVAFLLAFSLALFAVKIYISGKVQSYRIIASAMLQDEEGTITSANKKLENLSSFYANQPDPAGFLEKLSGVIPESAGLTSISLVFSKKDGGFSASLHGFSPTREELLKFKKNLESEVKFKDINFPPANWVKPENIEFSVNLKVEK